MSSPICAGEPNPSWISGPSLSSEATAVPRIAIDSSTNSANASAGARKRWPGIGSQIGSSTPPTYAATNT